MFNLKEHPHRRLNLLTGEWLLVSPHRTQRPWLGQLERLPALNQPAYDPDCYLCPGNQRAGGVRNPLYTSTFVFENDFAALKLDTPPGEFNRPGLLVAQPEPGHCRVVCFSPRHDLTVGRMSIAEMRTVVDTWIDQYRELGSLPQIQHVQIFENRGEMMGCSNPHPHCQIWANHTLPNEIVKEQRAQLRHWQQRGVDLLAEYLEIECQHGERLVCENSSFTVLVPFWAVWPFETMVIARRPVTALDELDEIGRNDLADILGRLTRRYDNLFGVPFPYSMGFHQRPTDGQEHREWRLHAHFYPPLLRSATVRKFMVGYEMLAMPQRDITPETAADRLRSLPED